MRPIKKAVCATGKYVKNGVEKNSYMTIGKLLERDDGSLCLKIDAVPVNFDGWVNFYDLDEQRQQSHQQGIVQAREAVGGIVDANKAAQFDDNIPF